MPRKWKDEERKPLALLRARAGFSGEKAAALLGVVMMTLYRYERGVAEIPLSIAEKMAILYRVPFDEIRQAVKNTPKKEKWIIA